MGTNITDCSLFVTSFQQKGEHYHGSLFVDSICYVCVSLVRFLCLGEDQSGLTKVALFTYARHEPRDKRTRDADASARTAERETHGMHSGANADEKLPLVFAMDDTLSQESPPLPNTLQLNLWQPYPRRAVFGARPPSSNGPPLAS